MKKFILLLTLIFLLVKPGWTTVSDLGEYLDSTCVSVRGSVLVNWDTWDENGETDNPDSIRYWITYSNTTTKLDNTGSTNNGNQWTGQYSEIFRAQRPGYGTGTYTMHVIFYDGSYVGDHLISWRVVPDSVTAVGRVESVTGLDTSAITRTSFEDNAIADNKVTQAVLDKVWSTGTRILTALDEDNTTIDLDGTTVGALTTTDKTGHILALNGLDSDTSFDMLQALVETNLDATISSRSDFDETSDAVVLDLDGLDADTSFDMLQALLETNLDATVSSRSDFDETSDAVVLDVDGLDDDTSWQAVQAKIDNALDDSLGTTKNLVQLLIDDSLGTSKNLTALLLDDSFGTTKNVINGVVATLIDDSLGSAKAAINLLIDDSLGSAKSTITGAVATLIDDSLGNTKNLVQLLLDDSFGVVKQTVYILLDDSFGTSKNLVALLLDDSFGTAKGVITGAVATLIDDSLGTAKNLIALLIDDSLGDTKEIIHVLIDDSLGDVKNTIQAGVTLADDAITAAKIATDAIGADEIATSAIGALEIATGAIGADEIASNAIGEPEIDANAITSSELATSAITEIAEEVNDSVWFADTAVYSQVGYMGSPGMQQGGVSGLTAQGIWQFLLDNTFDQTGDSIMAGHMMRHIHAIMHDSLLVASDTTDTLYVKFDGTFWHKDALSSDSGTSPGLDSSGYYWFTYIEDSTHAVHVTAVGIKNKTDSLFFLGGDSLLVKLGAAGTGDWTGSEKEEIRYAIGISGAKDTLHDSSYVKNIYYLSELLLDDSLGDVKNLIQLLLDDSFGTSKNLVALLLDDSLGDAKFVINVLIDDSLGDAKELMNLMTFVGGTAGSLSVDMSSMPSGSDTAAIREMLYSERWGLDTIWLAALAGGDSLRRIDTVMYIKAGAGAGIDSVKAYEAALDAITDVFQDDTGSYVTHIDTIDYARNSSGACAGLDVQACTLLVLDDDGNAVNGIGLSLQNSGGTQQYSGSSNSDGEAWFNTDTTTYYVVTFDMAGYNQDNTRDTFNVALQTRDTILIIAFDPGTPTDPAMCRLYQCTIRDPFGNVVANAKVTITLKSDYANLCDSTGKTIVAKAPKKQETRTDANGRWTADVYQNDKIYYKNSSGVITDAETYYLIIVNVSPQEKRIHRVDTESETSLLVY